MKKRSPGYRLCYIAFRRVERCLKDTLLSAQDHEIRPVLSHGVVCAPDAKGLLESDEA
jgi:hypothetical protein